MVLFKGFHRYSKIRPINIFHFPKFIILVPLFLRPERTYYFYVWLPFNAKVLTIYYVSQIGYLNYDTIIHQKVITLYHTLEYYMYFGLKFSKPHLTFYTPANYLQSVGKNHAYMHQSNYSHTMW